MKIDVGFFATRLQHELAQFTSDAVDAFIVGVLARSGRGGGLLGDESNLHGMNGNAEDEIEGDGAVCPHCGQPANPEPDG
jgi:hypothetical protein